MKNILFISMFSILFCIDSLAQSTLNYSKAIIFKSGDNYTVPSGFVLKIESINSISPNSTHKYSSCIVNCASPSCGVQCFYRDTVVFQLGSFNYSINSPQVNYTTGGACSLCKTSNTIAVTIPSLNFPIWLPAGEKVIVSAKGVYISALLFEIK
jgi:hypothetical protein